MWTAAARCAVPLGPMVGGALAGFGWYLLRRRTEVPSLSGAIADHRPIPRISMSIDAALQVLVVGSGASLGREGAPRQFAAALGDAGTSRWALTPHDREILLYCAAGAGLAAVYSVPLGGALFATQILMRTWHPRALGTALITSSLAVAVASPVTHESPPLDWPDPSLSYLLIAFALVLAPLAFGVGMVFNRLMAAARPAAAVKSWMLVPAVAAVGLLVGICSLHWPELPGNGKSILTVSLDSGMTLSAAAAILLLKPLLTASYLRAGAVGGLLTPALATGAAMGSLVALAVSTWTELAVSVPAVSLALRRRRSGDHAAGPDVGGALRLGTGPAAVVAARRLPGGRPRRARPATPDASVAPPRRVLRRLGPVSGVADDPHRHRAAQADVLHARAGGDDRGVLQDGQHRRHVPQPRFDGVDHLGDRARYRPAPHRSSVADCGRRFR